MKWVATPSRNKSFQFKFCHFLCQGLLLDSNNSQTIRVEKQFITEYQCDFLLQNACLIFSVYKYFKISALCKNSA